MRIFMALALLLSLFPVVAGANSRTLDKIITINRMTNDPAGPRHCSTADDGRTICTYTLYHYEIDEQGRLYFVKLTAHGEENSSLLQPGKAVSALICQLDAVLLCEMPEVDNKMPFDFGAYSVGNEGVTVHSLTDPWENPQKAALFLAQIKANAEAGLTAEDHSQSRMMDDLVCYVFDFDDLTREYKIQGRLAEDHLADLLRPAGCLTSFQKICADPGSRADELRLAGNARKHDVVTPKKFAINAVDIRNFCNSLKSAQSAMLR